MLVRLLLAALGAGSIFPAWARADDSPSFKAGVAARAITPRQPMWLAGYAGRNKPAEGAEHDLWLKALALEDVSGAVLVLVTSDLIGVPRELDEVVCAELGKRAGLPRQSLLFNASHTHSGPVLTNSLSDMYPLDAEQTARVESYTQQLEKWTVETVLAALADRKPARLSYGKGKAHFAINRRQATPKGFVIGRNPDGPVDPDEPVLGVRGLAG